MSKIICGYDIRPVRGSSLHLLVGHILNLETLTVSTAIRMADHNPETLERWVKDRQSKFGSYVNQPPAGKRINWKLPGAETTAKVRGHSVTADARFGVRAWVWMEMRGDRGQVNVPVLIGEEKPEAVHLEDETVNEVIRDLIGGTMEHLMDLYPLRSIWPVKRAWHGRYIPDLIPPAADESALDSGSSQELRA
jgi:hypothetical protein